MTRFSRIRAECYAEWYSFIRRRTAVFFTFLFPVILVVIFGALVTTESGGLFTEPPVYYVPGYVAVVLVFTPLSRVSTTIARHRDGHRFEKLATTPLTRGEWLFAHVLVNVILVGIGAVIVFIMVLGLTTTQFALSIFVIPFVGLGAALFCGLGAVLGRLTDSRDGAIAASNAIGLPILFLSDTFVPPALLPPWFRPVVALSPLTYIARGIRAVLRGTVWVDDLAVVGILVVIAVAAGVVSVPWRS